MTGDGLEIRLFEGDPKRFIHLLLIGDESEEMIERYLFRCRVAVGYADGEAVAVCAFTREGERLIEIKNLAVAEGYRRRGFGRGMLDFVERLNAGCRFQLGTGETPSTLRFYFGCGYRLSHRVKDFFTDNYPYPIVEEGVTLRDMLYLVKEPGLQSVDRQFGECRR